MDANGNTLTLRGFVTITHNSPFSPVDYTSADYERMRSLGTNYQSIRINAGSIGAWPDRTAQSAYLERLDSMVALAKEAGIYTQFKLTLYDVGNDWNALWENQNGEQQALIQGWKVLWERYKNEPAVIGYDLLNEPEQGGLGVSENEFIESYLTPFYRDAIDELHQIDQRHLTFIQPPMDAPSYGAVPIQRDRVVYAPHFYPGLWRYLFFSVHSTRGYGEMMERFVADARMHNAPLFIGEYGMPWDPDWDGDDSRQAEYQELERAAVNLFNEYEVGFSRPWFSDDRAKVTLGQYKLNWAIIKGEGGVAGDERRFITDIFARPYPKSIAGELSSFSYDRHSREFTLSYTPSDVNGLTSIFVPRARHYTDGFSVSFSDGTSVVHDASEPTGVRIVDNPAGLDASTFAWDEDRQVLSVREWHQGVPVTVTLS